MNYRRTWTRWPGNQKVHSDPTGKRLGQQNFNFGGKLPDPSLSRGDQMLKALELHSSDFNNAPERRARPHVTIRKRQNVASQWTTKTRNFLQHASRVFSQTVQRFLWFPARWSEILSQKSRFQLWPKEKIRLRLKKKIRNAKVCEIEGFVWPI